MLPATVTTAGLGACLGPQGLALHMQGGLFLLQRDCPQTYGKTEKGNYLCATATLTAAAF